MKNYKSLEEFQDEYSILFGYDNYRDLIYFSCVEDQIKHEIDSRDEYIDYLKKYYENTINTTRPN